MEIWKCIRGGPKSSFHGRHGHFPYPNRPLDIPDHDVRTGHSCKLHKSCKTKRGGNKRRRGIVKMNAEKWMLTCQGVLANAMLHADLYHPTGKERHHRRFGVEGYDGDNQIKLEDVLARSVQLPHSEKSILCQVFDNPGRFFHHCLCFLPGELAWDFFSQLQQDLVGCGIGFLNGFPVIQDHDLS